MLSDADRELRSHLNDAKRALEKALRVCREVSSIRPDLHASTPEGVRYAAEVQAQAKQAQQNHTQVRQALVQLERIGEFKSRISQDVDLMPEDVRASLSRESLRERVKEVSGIQKQATEQAVSNLLASLAGSR